MHSHCSMPTTRDEKGLDYLILQAFCFVFHLCGAQSLKPFVQSQYSHVDS